MSGSEVALHVTGCDDDHRKRATPWGEVHPRDNIGYSSVHFLDSHTPSFARFEGRSPGRISVYASGVKSKLIPKSARSRFACSANESFHVIEIGFKRFTPRTRKPVLGLGQTSFEVFFAADVLSFFKFSCVHAQVAIGGFQQFLKLVEAHRIIYRKRAHNSETDRFVNQPVQVRRAALSRSAAQALRFGVAYCFIVSSHHSSLRSQHRKRFAGRRILLP